MTLENDSKNYYEVLEISPSASAQDIEMAYRRARNAYSGDSVAMYSLLSSQECSQILAQIEEAYSIIGFPEKRREYDRIRGFNQAPHQQRSNAFTSSFSKPASLSSPPIEAFRYQEPSSPSPATTASTSSEKAKATQENASFMYEDYRSSHQEAKVSKIQALKKFGLEYDPNPEMESRIEVATEFTGAFLKQIREYKQVTIPRIVEMTRIAKSHIEAIETENLDRLPADAYTRGFVSQYAKVLKLNPDIVATSYLHHLKKLRGTK